MCMYIYIYTYIHTYIYLSFSLSIIHIYIYIYIYRNGTNWVSTNGVTADLVFFDGLFGCSREPTFILCQGVSFFQSVKTQYFCGGPMSVDPICPQPKGARGGVPGGPQLHGLSHLAEPRGWHDQPGPAALRRVHRALVPGFYSIVFKYIILYYIILYYITLYYILV